MTTKVSVLQENLAANLAFVSKAIAKKSSLQILSNVLLEVKQDTVYLSATDLQTSIRVHMGCKNTGEDWAVTLPARTFTDLIKTLPPERVDLTYNQEKQQVRIKCGSTASNLKGIDADEFPLMPNINDGVQLINITGEKFKTYMSQTLFAASPADNRPILTGALFQFAPDQFIMAAADGYRLSVYDTFIENVLQSGEFVVPAKPLAMIASAIEDNHTVTITANNFGNPNNPLIGSAQRIGLAFGMTEVTISLLEGKYPDYKAIIPKTKAIPVIVFTKELLQAAKRATIFARDVNNNIVLTLQDYQLTLAAISKERGDADTVIEVEYTGNEMAVNFNVLYLIDALNSLPEDRLVFYINGPTNPAVIQGYGNDDYMHVLMPMSVNR